MVKKELLALIGLCVYASAIPAQTPPLATGTAPLTPAAPPPCAVVASDARGAGCTLWSEVVTYGPSTAVDGTCLIMNLHPTKPVSGKIEFLAYGGGYVYPVGHTDFSGLASGAISTAAAPVSVLQAIRNAGPVSLPLTIFCRIDLLPSSSRDHADARQVRTSMSLAESTGRTWSQPLR
ncbi:hypothetical protein [Piscinibacter defluvii]|uniref:hypothetical protein n=1 Tax=Piscinibacter defluvii TaxID=1796922 RepID=UPI000FDE0A32|nr:hypothetical protein [Piscinibacter defluvii]